MMGSIIHAQDYYITFTGSGETATVDSIYVENLTQGTRLTLQGSDTLHLVYSLNVDAVNSNGSSFLLYPNPGESIFYVEFCNMYKSQVQFIISDISGKLFYSEIKELIPGLYNYEISGIPAGSYILSIKTNNNNYHSKIVSLNGNSMAVSVIQKSGTNTASVKTETKSTKQIFKMQYNDGERLLFKGYSQGRYARVLTLIPDASQNVEFYFIDCTDADSNHYAVVTIGGQTWMAENLRTTLFTNGEMIPNITNEVQWWNMTSSAYCWFNNDSNNYFSQYGALYNWYTIDSSNICPFGWHVPTLSEFYVLLDYLGGDSIAGMKLKETGTSHWYSEAYSNNESGFSALPGASRELSGWFTTIGSLCKFWSATNFSLNNPKGVYIMFYDQFALECGGQRTYGYSVRCIKD